MSLSARGWGPQAPGTALTLPVANESAAMTFSFPSGLYPLDGIRKPAVVLDGQKSTHSSILKDYQVDPIRGKIEHFDLQEVRLDEAIQTEVVVELVGESAGTKMPAGATE